MESMEAELYRESVLIHKSLGFSDSQRIGGQICVDQSDFGQDSCRLQTLLTGRGGER
jgi:hypothetical protein